MFPGTCGSAPGFRFCRGEAVLGTPRWGSPHHKGQPGALGGALPASVSPAWTWLFGSYVWVPAREVCRAAAPSAWCSPARPRPLTAVSTGGRGGSGLPRPPSQPPGVCGSLLASPLPWSQVWGSSERGCPALWAWGAWHGSSSPRSGASGDKEGPHWGPGCSQSPGQELPLAVVRVCPPVHTGLLQEVAGVQSSQECRV